MTPEVKRWLGSDIIDIAIRVTVIATLAISIISYVNWHNLATCQASYNQAYAQFSLAARDTRQEDDRVLQELFSSLWNARQASTKAGAAATQKAVDAAFTKYFSTTESNREFRAAHPAPPLPDQYCG